MDVAKARAYFGPGFCRYITPAKYAFLFYSLLFGIVDTLEPTRRECDLFRLYDGVNRRRNCSSKDGRIHYDLALSVDYALSFIAFRGACI